MSAAPVVRCAIIGALIVLSARPAQPQTDARSATATLAIPAQRNDSASIALLVRAGKAYKGARTLRAAFTQELVNPRTRTNLRSAGEFFQQGAQRFAFKFSAPAEDRVVSDGQVLWLYSPSTAAESRAAPRAASRACARTTAMSAWSRYPEHSERHR